MKIKQLILIALLIVISFTICGCMFLKWENENEFKYCKSANWNCNTNAEFLEKYKPFYLDNTDKILNNYHLNFEKIVDVDEKNGGFNLYYYNDNATIHFSFLQTAGFAFFKANCYYFSENEITYTEFNNNEQNIMFLNDIVTSFAYDARGDENTFSKLFNESINGKGYASYCYHYDSFCGNVGYYVELNNKHNSYYYKMCKNEDIQILATRFQFEGILKPQNSI